jgi:UDP-glucose 4-epimerase
MADCDVVFHLQANADVRHGLEHPLLDLEQNAQATVAVLEAMLANQVGRIAFSSTGSIYGEPEVFPTPEDAPFPVQTSLYGNSKAAAEGLISAYCHGHGLTGTALRFVSVLGERYTHGHVFDFYRALRADSSRLRILGNGQQRKSYMHVSDCVEGILAGTAATAEGSFEAFNIGTDETIVVDDSVAIITAHMGVSPELEHTGGERGWPGDSPLIHLDCAKLRGTGWEPKLTIREGLERTLKWFDSNSWVFE